MFFEGQYHRLSDVYSQKEPCIYRLRIRSAKDDEDEKHVHPLQLDVIERAVVMWSNPGEIVFTPFMGVGSEVYQAVAMGRKGIGAELKESYFRQAVKNLESAMSAAKATEHPTLFSEETHEDDAAIVDGMA